LLEEFFDADPSTAAALKDILTEKGFREGSNKKESLISSVIICGNKTPEDVSVDDSTKAFYQERFPYRCKMIWETFYEKNYTAFFSIYYKKTFTENRDELLLVAKLCATTDKRISPRIAAEAADTAIDIGVEFLDTLPDLDVSLIEEMKHQVQEESIRLTETELLDKIQERVVQYIDLLRQPAIITVYNEYRYALQMISMEMTNVSFSDRSFKRLTEIKSLVATALGTIEHLMLEDLDLESMKEDIQELFYGDPTQ
jgi:hypothetical protein